MTNTDIPDIPGVIISADGYNAFVTAQPNPAAAQVTVESLRAALKAKGVVYGISEKILTGLAKAFKAGQGVENIHVAAGKPAREGKKTTVTLTYKQTAGDAASHQNITPPFVIVKKNRILAIKTPGVHGADGITVTGKEIKVPVITDIPLKAGENVARVKKEGKIYYGAVVAGVVVYKNDTLSVSTSLKIQRNLDNRTGNILFNGDVTVEGDVKPDFTLEAGKDINIGGSIIAARIKSAGDVAVTDGIVGKYRGTVTSKGTISATHVDKAMVNAGGDVIIRNGISASEIRSGGVVKVVNQGSRVVTSLIKAAKGIKVKNVGSRLDHKTRLITGFAPELEGDFNHVKESLEANLSIVKKIEGKYTKEALQRRAFRKAASPNQRKDIEKWDILTQEIKNARELMKEWEPRVYHYDAIVEIKGKIFPGIYLKIGKYGITTSKEYNNIKVRYSEELAKLEII